MTMEAHTYREPGLLDDEKITLIAPAWVEPPKSITVSDVGRNIHLFTKEHS